MSLRVRKCSRQLTQRIVTGLGARVKCPVRCVLCDGCVKHWSVELCENTRGLVSFASPFLQGLVYSLATDGQGAILHGLLGLVTTKLQGQNLVGAGKRRLPIGFL